MNPITAIHDFIKGFNQGIRNGLSDIKAILKFNVWWCKDTWRKFRCKGFEFVWQRWH